MKDCLNIVALNEYFQAIKSNYNNGIMKKYFLILLFFISCENQPKPLVVETPKKLSLDEKIKEQIKGLTSETDSTFLGFVLGASKIETEKHLKDLINKKIMKSKQTINFSSYLTSKSFNISGYGYSIFTDDKTEMTCLVDFNYTKNKLYSIDIVVRENFDIHKLAPLFNSKYGNYKGQTTDEESRSNTWIWLHGNTKIEITDGGLGGITYTNLKESTLLESAKKEAKKLKIDSGLKQTKKSI